MSDATLQKTPLHALHLELGARMVPFAGYDRYSIRWA
jgi:aminomethyltransferase